MCIRLEGYIREEGAVWWDRTTGRIAIKSHNKEIRIQLKFSMHTARLSLVQVNQMPHKFQAKQAASIGSHLPPISSPYGLGGWGTNQTDRTLSASLH